MLLKANRVLDWVQQQPQAFVHPALSIQLDQHGGLALGLSGEGGLQKEEQVFSVPREALLECPAGAGPGKQHAALALRLLHERSKADMSKWEAYITSLPSPADGLHYNLLMWHLEELQQQQQQQQPGEGTSGDVAEAPMRPSAESHSVSGNAHTAQTTTVQELLHASPSAELCFQKAWDRLVAEYKDLPQLTASCEVCAQDQPKPAAQQQQALDEGAPHMPPPPWQSYVWARCIVSSRAIHLWSGPTLVPLADFLNHSKPPNVVCRCFSEEPAAVQGCSKRSIYSPPSSSCDSDDEEDEEEGDEADKPVCGPLHQAFVCEAVHEMRGGEELLWVYNSHSQDTDWLVGYGFIPCDGSSSPALAMQGPQAQDELPNASDVAVTSTHDSAGACSGLDAAAERVREGLARIDRLDPQLQARAAGIRLLLEREMQGLAVLRQQHRQQCGECLEA